MAEESLAINSYPDMILSPSVTPGFAQKIFIETFSENRQWKYKSPLSTALVAFGFHEGT